MSLPSTTDDTSQGAGLERAQSRERAVTRVFGGLVVGGIGWVGQFVVPLAELFLGASQQFQEVWAIGARGLVWIGVLIAATAGTHLLRFGGRRGAVAFVSFAAAGASGLLAVAEQFETWFLESRVLTGLDVWGLAGVVLFMLLGAWLLASDAEPRPRTDRDEA